MGISDVRQWTHCNPLCRVAEAAWNNPHALQCHKEQCSWEKGIVSAFDYTWQAKCNVQLHLILFRKDLFMTTLVSAQKFRQFPWPVGWIMWICALCHADPRNQLPCLSVAVRPLPLICGKVREAIKEMYAGEISPSFSNSTHILKEWKLLLSGCAPFDDG